MPLTAREDSTVANKTTMKNVLFISPDTFGYYKAISAAIAQNGHNPIWLNQLPATTILARILFRLAPSIGHWWADRHFAKELDKLDRIDHILIIKGEGISEATIAQMRRRYPSARIVFYLWDSLANTPGAERKIQLCDASFSFDPVDCDRNKDLKHLPLFYSKKAGSTMHIPGYAAFIGTLHSDRYQLIKSLGEEIERITGIKPFLYFYYPNRKLFVVLKLLKKTFWKIRVSDLHYEPVPRERYEAIQSTAEIAIDICHPKQSGLTMRSIEALGAGKKLITNNKTVRRYDFFRPENCYVIDGQANEDFSYFLKSAYQPLAPETVARYHIDAWLQTLMIASNV